MTRFTKNAALIGTAFAALLAVSACSDNDGPAEEAGEQIDETADEADDAVEETADEVEESTD